MDDPKTKLDAYLENLGISEDAEDGPPALPAAPASPVAPEPPRAADARAALASVASPERTLESSARPRLIASPEAIVEDFLAGMLVYLDPTFGARARHRNDQISAEIVGGDPGKVIGREGRTLAAIEFLANTVMAKESGEVNLRVSVDASGYRRRHEERLLEIARRAAARVRKDGDPVELDPMNAADRRIIHIALKEDEFVTTESAGEGRERRVIVKTR